ncbi:MAG: LysM domain-containing protein [Blautia sp.]|nr:LysM domain-containing protein [Blautia sp.]
MKKRMLALLLGGALAVGGGVLAVPATAQAADKDDLKSEDWQNWAKELDCEGRSDAHIESGSVDVVNGLLTVTVEVQTASDSAEMWGGFVYVCEEAWEADSNVGDGSTDYYDFIALGSSATASKQLAESGRNGSKGSYKFTFEGLTVGKTYYVYCQVWDPHNDSEATLGSHYAVCLGTGVPTATSAPGSSTSNKNPANSSTSNSASSSSSSAGSSAVEENSYTRFENSLADQIETAASGSTVVMDKGISALSNSTMKELLAKGDVSLRMEFTYQDKEYVIIIPAGAALDNDIPWYGPLYLAQHFGNSAGTAATTGAAGTYEVKSGDSLSRIAKENNMTLQQLLAKNPQIKDPNKIIVGQKINR